MNDDSAKELNVEKVELVAEPYNSITITISSNGNIGHMLNAVIDVLQNLK